MSAFKEVLLSGLEEYLQRLQVAIEGLSPAEVRWQPTMHTNHIAWLVWHMASRRVLPGWCVGCGWPESVEVRRDDYPP